MQRCNRLPFQVIAALLGRAGITVAGPSSRRSPAANREGQTPRNIAVALLIALASLVVLSSTGCSANARASAGGGQTIQVNAQGHFTPEAVAQAGVPITLEFGRGADCTAAIKFPQYGIFEDLTDGGGVVQLPALAPGRYPLLCQADMTMGELIVK